MNSSRTDPYLNAFLRRNASGQNWRRLNDRKGRVEDEARPRLRSPMSIRNRSLKDKGSVR